MRRIFISNLSEQKTVILDKDNQHYLKKVLRVNIGQEILMFDGNIEVLAILKESDKAEVIKTVRVKSENTLQLAIPPIKKERFEWLVEKATELGVTEIHTIITKRTQNDINFKRLHKISVEASRQSGRVGIPVIHQSIPLDNFLKKVNANEWCYGSINENCNNNIKTNISGIIIGPEGGWDKSENNILQSKSIMPIFLNKNILRSETAAISGLSLITQSFIN